MAIDTTSRARRALMPEDNELVAASVKQLGPEWILHLTALVTLSTSGFCRTGALALLHGLECNGFALLLFDIDCGDTLWLHALSAKTEFVRVPSAERKHLLTDGRDLNEICEIIFEDAHEEEVMARNIPKACRRLGKRACNSRRRNSTGGDIPALPRDSEDLSLPETLLPQPTHGASPTPLSLSRRLTLKPVVEITVEQQRRNTAPPVLESGGDISAPHIVVIDSVQERIVRWLECTTVSSQNPIDSPTAVSAPPSVLIHPPAEGDPNAAKIEERHLSSSCPRMRSPSNSETLLVPGTVPTIHLSNESPAQVSGLRVWKATLNNRQYTIPDITQDISDINQVTGEGGFGNIRKAKLHDYHIALKQIKPSRDFLYSPKLKMAESKRFIKEVIIAMLCNRLHHKNIVEFKGVAISEELGACLVSPWMKYGNSLEYVNSPAHPLRYPIIRGALEGLEYLHRKGFVHGDMKAQNVLISDDRIPLISDFGLATFVEFVDEPQSRSILQAGNAQWSAPELADQSTNKWTKMSDMWAFGMFAIEILTGDLPFGKKRTFEVHIAVYHRSLPARPTHPECSDILWDLIQCCWHNSPDERITARQILERLEESGDKIRSGGIL